jgi:hypothetical protein
MRHAPPIRPVRLAFTLVIATIGTFACESERITVPPIPPPPGVGQPSVPAPVPVPVPSRLDVSYLPPALMEGARVMPLVLAYTEQNSPAAPPALTWETTDRDVLAIEATFERTVLLRAVAPGTATIVIRGGGLTEAVDVVVHPLPVGTISADSSGVVISDFHMLSYFDDYGGRLYAPQLTMSARDGLAYDVLRLQFAIPGLPPLAPCSGVRALATIPAPIFASSYDSWEIEYRAAVPHDSGARATAVIDLLRSSGGTIRMVVDGPVVPARAPSGQNGSGGFEPWSCP